MNNFGYINFGKFDGFEIFEIHGAAQVLKKNIGNKEFVNAIQLPIGNIGIEPDSVIYSISEINSYILVSQYEYSLDQYGRRAYTAGAFVYSNRMFPLDSNYTIAQLSELIDDSKKIIEGIKKRKEIEIGEKDFGTSELIQISSADEHLNTAVFFDQNSESRINDVGDLFTVLKVVGTDLIKRIFYSKTTNSFEENQDLRKLPLDFLSQKFDAKISSIKTRIEELNSLVDKTENIAQIETCKNEMADFFIFKEHISEEFSLIVQNFERKADKRITEILFREKLIMLTEKYEKFERQILYKLKYAHESQAVKKIEKDFEKWDETEILEQEGLMDRYSTLKNSIKSILEVVIKREEILNQFDVKDYVSWNQKKNIPTYKELNLKKDFEPYLKNMNWGPIIEITNNLLKRTNKDLKNLISIEVENTVRKNEKKEDSIKIENRAENARVTEKTGATPKIKITREKTVIPDPPPLKSKKSHIDNLRESDKIWYLKNIARANKYIILLLGVIGVVCLLLFNSKSSFLVSNEHAEISDVTNNSRNKEDKNKVKKYISKPKDGLKLERKSAILTYIKEVEEKTRSERRYRNVYNKDSLKSFKAEAQKAKSNELVRRIDSITNNYYHYSGLSKKKFTRIIHSVVEGNTIHSISQKYGVKKKWIIYYNPKHTKNEIIHPGNDLEFYVKKNE